VSAAGIPPLAGLRAIDLSTVFAVPYIGGLLTDFGVDVIKVEAPDRLDQTRGGGFGPWFDNDPGEEGWNRSGTFQSLNRAKRSIVLDLKSEQGRDVLRSLIAGADILLDNFTPRVLRGWGMTYAELSEINPRLIHLSNTGYGSTGPWASYRAQGTTLEATMGLAAYSGYEGEAPAKVGQSYPDFVAAWAGLVSLGVALVHREATGEGQWIDMGMYQTGPLVSPESLIAVQAGEEDLATRGNRELDAIYSGVVRIDGDDRWVTVSVPDDVAWARVAQLVPGLGDARIEPRAVDLAIESWAAGQPEEALLRQLRATGSAAARVQDARDLLADPQLRAHRFYEMVDHEDGVGMRPLIARPYRIEGSTVTIRGRAPRYGEHNEQILHEAGRTDEDIAALREKQVVVDAPLNPPRMAPTRLDVFVKSGTYREIDPHYVEHIAAYARDS
jgi:crotonobetainyl-CoA:carnitine CoA-transferase CaiB-like acyl-CoA transferase